MFDFKDPKAVFKTLITKFKQLDLDLHDNMLDVYNLILSSMYQDEDINGVPESSIDIQ